MEKRAFEQTGLVPRSIIRTFDRFRKQLFPSANQSVIREFRISRYQVLVSVKSLVALISIPLLVNFLVKTLLLTPLTEYVWNNQQNEVFLNSYQEDRAFIEMQEFEDKLFFESLIASAQSTRTAVKIEDFKAPVKIFDFKRSIQSPRWPFENRRFSQALQPQTNLQVIFSKQNGSLKSSILKANIPTYLSWKNHWGNCFPYFTLNNYKKNTNLFFLNTVANTNTQKTPNFPSFNFGNTTFWAKQVPSTTAGLKRIPYLLDQNNLEILYSRYLDTKFFFQTSFIDFNSLSKSSVLTGCKQSLNPFWLSRGYSNPLKKVTDQRSQLSIDRIANESLVSILNPLIWIQPPQTILIEKDQLNENLRYQNFVYQEFLDQSLKQNFQTKTLELAIYYNQQSIEAITNVFGDFTTFITISLLFFLMRPQIIILKSFLTESIYSLSDTTKSFLLILLTDLLVGFHSPRGWEIFIEIVLRHFGLPENQDFIFLFVATFPVLLDTVFKYWIFRYLNQISPSTVATYHSMIE